MQQVFIKPFYDNASSPSLYWFQFLEQYGEVSMLDIKGSDATKVVLLIGIMTLHSSGEDLVLGFHLLVQRVSLNV